MPEPRPRPPEEAWDGIVMANALLAAMEAATQRRKNPNASVSRAPSTIVASRVGSRSSARRLALTRGERDERRAAIHRFSRRDDGGARLALRANRRGLRASVNHTSNSQSNQSINQSNPRDIAHISPTLLSRERLSPIPPPPRPKRSEPEPESRARIASVFFFDLRRPLSTSAPNARDSNHRSRQHPSIRLGIERGETAGGVSSIDRSHRIDRPTAVASSVESSRVGRESAPGPTRVIARCVPCEGWWSESLRRT